MGTAEAIVTTQNMDALAKPTFKDRLIAQVALGTALASIGGGSYLGYNHMNGPISSVHRGHEARVARYQTCEQFVIANDADNDGIARVRLENMPQEELQACGFAGVWNETSRSLDRRHNLLDGWIPTFDLTGIAQLPSRQALDQAIESEKQTDHVHVEEDRIKGIMAGGFAGGVAWALAGVGILVTRVKRKMREELDEEIAAGPHDWVGLPASQRPAPYDWWAENAQ